MKDKIFIIGFMGSGKSHWGKIWAKEVGFEFYDLDRMIEKGEEKLIGNIFRDGEEKFREIEARYLRSFDGKNNFVLACGGGTPCFHENMEWMNLQGATIYLQVLPAVLVQRIMDDKTDRPLIKEKDPGKLIGFVEGLLKEREAFYSRANMIINEERLTTQLIKDML